MLISLTQIVMSQVDQVVMFRFDQVVMFRVDQVVLAQEKCAHGLEHHLFAEGLKSCNDSQFKQSTRYSHTLV